MGFNAKRHSCSGVIWIACKVKAAKETSDIDLILIVSRPADYLNTPIRLQQFGAIKKRQIEPYGVIA